MDDSVWIHYHVGVAPWVPDRCPLIRHGRDWWSRKRDAGDAVALADACHCGCHLLRQKLCYICHLMGSGAC